MWDVGGRRWMRGGKVGSGRGVDTCGVACVLTAAQLAARILALLRQVEQHLIINIPLSHQ